MAADAHTDAVAVYPPGDEATALWRIRADGAGLGGRTPLNPETGEGNAPAWPGLEDAAVPPENLGRYLRDFTTLMSDYGIDGLLYGHFGDGCVHVRLDMPLETDEGVAHSRRFMEEAAKICASYGGSIGEHGDGRSRSELLRFMYSPDMLDLFAQIKALFDPRNLLNPGVLTAPMSAEVAAQRKEERKKEPGSGQAGQDAEAGQDPQPGVDLLDQYLRRPRPPPSPPPEALPSTRTAATSPPLSTAAQAWASAARTPSAPLCARPTRPPAKKKTSPEAAPASSRRP